MNACACARACVYVVRTRWIPVFVCLYVCAYDSHPQAAQIDCTCVFGVRV